MSSRVRVRVISYVSQHLGGARAGLVAPGKDGADVARARECCAPRAPAFEEGRLDEQRARADERGQARGALDEAGGRAGAGGVRVPAQVQRKDVHLFFGRIWGRHVRVCSVTPGAVAVVARARAVAAVAAVLTVVAMMTAVLLSVPAVVAVVFVFVVVRVCVRVYVRVRGAARAREEGPAARGGDVAHVQDPDWSP